MNNEQLKILLAHRKLKLKNEIINDIKEYLKKLHDHFNGKRGKIVQAITWIILPLIITVLIWNFICFLFMNLEWNNE